METVVERPLGTPVELALRRLDVATRSAYVTVAEFRYDDRFRGVYGTRRVLLMNPADITRLGFNVGDHVTVHAVAHDEERVSRSVEGLRLTSYDIPLGCAAGYYPECNPLIPLWHHAEKSFVPAAKAIPVRLSLT